MGHSCGTLLWDTLVGYSCRTLLWDTLVGHSCGTSVSYETSRVKSESISYETSSKSHTSSLQNERFVRDFLKKSHVKSPKRAFRTRLPQKLTSKSAKRAFRTRLPPKVKRKHPSEHTHTHHAALPSSFAIPAPPNNIRSHANPFVTATFTSTTTHNLTVPCTCHESFRVHTSNAYKVLRLPRNVTSVTPRNLTIPCACHENRTSTPQNPHKVLRLPREVTISSHVSFNKNCTAPHVWILWDTLVGHFCRTLLWDTVAGHSCGTLLRDTLVGQC